MTERLLMLWAVVVIFGVIFLNPALAQAVFSLSHPMWRVTKLTGYITVGCLAAWTVGFPIVYWIIVKHKEKKQAK